MAEVNIIVDQSSAARLSTEFKKRGGTRNTLTLRDGPVGVLLTLADGRLTVFTGGVTVQVWKDRLLVILRAAGVYGLRIA